MITGAGLAWTGIAFGIAGLFGLSLTDAREVAVPFAVAGVVTSYAVTWLFRAHLFAADVKRKRSLPFATIACGATIWSTGFFVLAAVSSLIQGQHDLFDGFGAFLIVGIASSLTIALPVTYPAAYLTQIVIARYAAPKTA